MVNRFIKLSACLFLCLLSTQSFAQSDPNSRLSELERVVQKRQRRVTALEAQIQSSNPASVVIKPGNSKDTANWRQLRKGMTEQDVERLLGSAGKVNVNEYFFTWYYDYPNGGSVQFNAKSGKLEGWNEP